MTEFGAGIFLTDELDFEVTNTGDIRSVSGIGELEKDLALVSLIQLDDLIGAPQRNSTKAKMQSRINAILIADPRINNTIDTNIRFSPAANSAEVVSTVASDDGEQELVFTL